MKSKKQKQIKANNYAKVEEALKEIGGEALLTKVNSSISKSERKMFHVVLMKTKYIPGSLKNQGTVVVVKYHKHGFEKIQKNFAGQYDKLFILHNPDELGEEEEIIIPSHQKAKTEAEIRAEVEKEKEAEFQKRLDKALKEQKEAVKQDNKLESFKDKKVIDISGLIDSEPTVDSMREFAKANELGLKGAKTKDEVKAALIESVEEHNKNVKLANNA